MNAKGIYAYKDTETNRIVYIGQTIQSFYIRHKQHLSSRGNNLFNNKLQKHPQKYKLIPLISFYTTNVSKEQLNKLEKYYIKQCNTYHKENESGLNLTIGGAHSYDNFNRLSKYTLFDSSKTHYLPCHMYQNNTNGDKPKKCFMLRYKGNDIPIGQFFYEPYSPQIISTLIEEFT